MSRKSLLSVLLVVVLAGLAVLPVVAGASSSVAPRFRAVLTGRQEVPPVQTFAFGQGYYALHTDRWGEQCVRYAVFVENIDNVILAHFHLAPKGVNGPVVADLLENAKVWNGATLGGCIYEEDLVGPLAGMTLADLVEAAVNGQIYTNVHTVEHPGGEIRGQLKVVGGAY
jgi:hypothetical protein